MVGGGSPGHPHCVTLRDSALAWPWLCDVLLRAQANQAAILADLEEMEQDDPMKWLEGFAQFCGSDTATKPGRKKHDAIDKTFDFTKLMQSRCLCCANVDMTCDCDCAC